ncbi:hypothetical protein SAICODRAFT_153674 [Saitoella complicata NRRL Y-17804]|uniref:uncharacterized protein n=1 Tax=Saitoella complicata (strain BCRC 22490 / CBS 7301 / JCM 7358 / NBRC 10748 / NRRL Y-17804) TaxID=698492 RepID=UPI000866FCE5|nr:uncharacterized protein SAICODRAFT_153674 [Saitoella complicata NRRL Y-17804]ODQ55920.1 hypothetical protein SAICODRAFT_153674 [Saitoella complicata NRRL Y-17804]
MNGTIHDILCAGFGPAGLAIAVALHDHPATSHIFSSYTKGFPGHRGSLADSGYATSTPPSPSSETAPASSVLFLEKQAQFRWHPGMLIPGSRMQISFLKDMCTLRDPTSSFSFLCYLKSKGRLVNYINLGTFYPRREEYEDYLRWAAGRFGEVVRYSREVVGVETTELEGGRVVRVTARNVLNNETETYLTRNLILSTGGQARFPTLFAKYTPHPRLIHSSSFLTSLPSLPLPTLRRVAVLGGGQSSAEIFRHLTHILPSSSEIDLVIRARALKPSDDSPFVNEVFNPESTDVFFDMSETERDGVRQDLRATNYGVVRNELLEELYEDLYIQDNLHPDTSRTRPRAQILTRREILAVKPNEDESFTLQMRNAATGEEYQETYDAIFLGTGYHRALYRTLLAPLSHLLRTAATRSGSADGEVSEEEDIVISRDYRVQLVDGKEGPRIWLQGTCERTHGLKCS